MHLVLGTRHHPSTGRHRHSHACTQCLVHVIIPPQVGTVTVMHAPSTLYKSSSLHSQAPSKSCMRPMPGTRHHPSTSRHRHSHACTQCLVHIIIPPQVGTVTVMHAPSTWYTSSSLHRQAPPQSFMRPLLGTRHHHSTSRHRHSHACTQCLVQVIIPPQSGTVTVMHAPSARYTSSSFHK